jgi:NAD+ kinase
MQKKRSSANGEKGRIIVYVDAQLQQSKRFDAEGMKQEYPEFFVPMPKRRSSSSSHISAQSHADSNGETEEGQLRYWTADMCTRSPHLFDFVVTVGVVCLKTSFLS